MDLTNKEREIGARFLVRVMYPDVIDYNDLGADGGKYYYSEKILSDPITIRNINGAKVVYSHVDVTGDNAHDYTIGVAINSFYNKDASKYEGEGLYTEIEIWNQVDIEKIYKEKPSVSICVSFNEEVKKGTFNGKSYDHVVHSIHGAPHLAIVPDNEMPRFAESGIIEKLNNSKKNFKVKVMFNSKILIQKKGDKMFIGRKTRSGLNSTKRSGLARKRAVANSLGLRSGLASKRLSANSLGLRSGLARKRLSANSLGLRSGLARKRLSANSLGLRSGLARKRPMANSLGLRSGLARKRPMANSLGLRSGLARKRPMANSLGLRSGLARKRPMANSLGLRSGLARKRPMANSLGLRSGLARKRLSANSLGLRSGLVRKRPVANSLGLRSGLVRKRPVANSLGLRSGLVRKRPVANSLGLRSGLVRKRPVTNSLGLRSGLGFAKKSRLNSLRSLRRRNSDIPMDTMYDDTMPMDTMIDETTPMEVQELLLENSKLRRANSFLKKTIKHKRNSEEDSESSDNEVIEAVEVLASTVNEMADKIEDLENRTSDIKEGVESIENEEQAEDDYVESENTETEDESKDEVEDEVETESETETKDSEPANESETETKEEVEVKNAIAKELGRNSIKNMSYRKALVVYSNAKKISVYEASKSMKRKVNAKKTNSLGHRVFKNSKGSESILDFSKVVQEKVSNLFN